MTNATGPLNWKRKKISLVKTEHPVATLQRQMNRVLSDFFTGNSFLPEFVSEPLQQLGERWNSFSPNVNVIRGDEEILVCVELPGMAEEDIELSLTRDSLTIRGERKQPVDVKPRDGTTAYFESSFGSFERLIPLEDEIEEESVDASFSRGILSIRIKLRSPSSSPVRKVSIRAGALS